MIKIIEDLQDNKIKNIDKNINTVICRLKNIRENLQISPGKYDLENLYDILSQIYDDIGDFNITVTENRIWGVMSWQIPPQKIINL